MSAMTARDFERRYRACADPWGYRSSPYERSKYAATLDACGRGPFEAALELGGSIGVFSTQLAPRCRSLTTVDFSPTAAREALAALGSILTSAYSSGRSRRRCPRASSISWSRPRSSITSTPARSRRRWSR